MKMVEPLYGGNVPVEIHGAMAGQFPMTLALWCEQNEATEADLVRAIEHGVPLRIVDHDEKPAAPAEEE